MANTLSDSFPDWWSRRLQKLSIVRDIYRAITSFEEAGQLKVGDTVDRPYKGTFKSRAVGTAGAYERQDVTITSEKLTVDVKREVSFYVEDYNELQSKYPVAKSFAKDASIALYNWIDGDVLGEYDQADSVVANYELGGGGSSKDGIGFTLTTANILRVFSLANRKMDKLNVAMENRWAAISPEFRDVLFQFIAGKESALGDATGKNGDIGKYAGFRLRVSNATGWSGRLELLATPTTTNTVIINGVTLRLITTIAQAGDVAIGADAAASAVNLAAMINDTEGLAYSTEGTLYWNLTKANRDLLTGISAVSAATYITVKAEGWGTVIVSETLADATSIWTTTKQIQHQLFGQGKPIDLVIQKYPTLGIFHRDGHIGKDFVSWILYGLKTFDEGDRALVDVQVRSDAF